LSQPAAVLVRQLDPKALVQFGELGRQNGFGVLQDDGFSSDGDFNRWFKLL
jgi:hypothetical protein